MDYFHIDTDLLLLRHLSIYLDQIVWCICLRMSGLWLLVIRDFHCQPDRANRENSSHSCSIALVASLAFGVEPLGAMDLLRVATYAQDQDQQLIVVYMGLFFVSDVALVERLLRPAVCMGIVLLQR
jgi:hypothetical protein